MARQSFSHVVGFDDGPFDKYTQLDVPVVGAVFSDLRLEGVLTGKVRTDGVNSTRTLVRMVSESKFAPQLQLVLLQGIALAGFNVIDIINTIAGPLLGTLMAIFLIGMFTPRANSQGALIGLAAGAASLVFVVTMTGIPKWWYGAFTIGITWIVGILASYLFAPPQAEALAATVWESSDQ